MFIISLSIVYVNNVVRHMLDVVSIVCRGALDDERRWVSWDIWMTRHIWMTWSVGYRGTSG